MLFPFCTCVATQLLEECDDDTHILEMGTWEFVGTPKFLELGYRDQNTSHWGSIYIIGKLSKCRCRKWACMNHLDIWSTSYVKKKGRESTRPWCVQVKCDIPLESSWRGLQLCSRPHCNRRFAEEVMRLQSGGSSSYWNFGTHSGVLRQKVIWMWPSWRVSEYIIWGKVVASPKSGPLWILWVQVIRGLS
jgi:hypothetical protein